MFATFQVENALSSHPLCKNVKIRICKTVILCVVLHYRECENLVSDFKAGT
jgi:hypothetical protein